MIDFILNNPQIFFDYYNREGTEDEMIEAYYDDSGFRSEVIEGFDNAFYAGIAKQAYAYPNLV